MNNLKETEIGLLPEDWEIIKVADVIQEKGIAVGVMYPGEDTPEGIPMIRVADIKAGKINNTPGFYISNTVNDLHKRTILNGGEVIVTLVGNPGKTVVVSDKFKGWNVARAIGVLKLKDPSEGKFISYSLSTPYSKFLIDSYLNTTVQPTLNLGDLKQVQIPWPNRNNRLLIAEVLSSLDDKIDMLHRNNKTLEQLAEILFRQWFNNETETKPVIYFGKIVCGKTPSKTKSDFFDGPTPFLKIPDMHGRTFVFKTTDSLTEMGKKSQLNKTVPPFSISVSCIATVGLVTINAYECQTNQQINSIIPNKEYFRYFLFNYFKSITNDLIQRASSGSVTHNLNTGDFSNIEIPFFKDNLYKSFDDAVSPLYQKIYKNEVQIHKLENLRDTLLPKLMSGNVRVEN